MERPVQLQKHASEALIFVANRHMFRRKLKVEIRARSLPNK